VEHAIGLVIGEFNSYNHLVVRYARLRHPSTVFLATKRFVTSAATTANDGECLQRVEASPQFFGSALFG
jgi:hypothetical protein